MNLKLTKKQSRGVFHLPIEQAVYVPSTYNKDKKIPSKQYKKRINEVRNYLASKYGGYSSVRIIGGYQLGKSLVKESATKVVAFATERDYKDHKAELMNKLRIWGKKWGQHSMGYEYEGDLYYFPKQKKRRKK